MILVFWNSLNCGASLRTDTIFWKLRSCERHQNMSTEETTGDYCYDPEDGHILSIEDWLRDVQTFARNSGLSEDQKYCFARGKLKGSAKAWMDAVSDVTCWSDFEREIRKRFSINKSEERFTRILSKRKIQKGESVEQFFTNIMLLGRKHRISEKAVMKHVMSAIGSSIHSDVNNLEQSLTCSKWKQVTNSGYGFDKLADELENAVIGDMISKTSIPTKMIRIMTDNSENILSRLNDILTQFRSAVSVCSYDTGTSKTHELVINVKSPEAKKSPENIKPVDHLYLANLLKENIIRKSHSTFLNNYIYKEHLLLDLRELNSMTAMEPVDPISLEVLLHALPYFRFFTTLTFNGGHLQIPVQKASRKYFAFSTNCGNYEYSKAPKEFVNTGSVFNKILIEVAKKLEPGDVVVLFDELIIPSARIEDGYSKLEKVMAALQAFGLTIDLRGSSFFAEELILFHWRISAGQQVYMDFPKEQIPKNDRFLQRFIMQDNRLSHVEPNSLSCNLETQARKLACRIDLRQGFELYVSHSKHNITSVLTQKENASNRIPLGIYNKRLSSEEQNLKTSEIGILAMVESVLHFKQFLDFKPCTLITSNRKFYSAMKPCNLTDDLLRKLLLIQNMSISVVLEPIMRKNINVESLAEEK